MNHKIDRFSLAPSNASIHCSIEHCSSPALFVARDEMVCDATNNNHEHECPIQAMGPYGHWLSRIAAPNPPPKKAMSRHCKRTNCLLCRQKVDSGDESFAHSSVELILLPLQAFSQIVKKVIGIESDKLCRSGATNVGTIGGLRYLETSTGPTRRYRDSVSPQVDLRVAG